MPSSVSAVKVDGRRSYDRVRAGEEVELAPRSVTVHRLDVHRISRPTPDLVDVDVTVACTAGTYIRAIARDAGAALGVGGHLTALRRTASGPVLGRRRRARSRRPPPRWLAGGGTGRARADRGRHHGLPRRGRSPPRRPRALGLRPADPGHRRARDCTPPWTPTAGWSPSSRTPARPHG